MKSCKHLSEDPTFLTRSSHLESQLQKKSSSSPRERWHVRPRLPPKTTLHNYPSASDISCFSFPARNCCVSLKIHWSFEQRQDKVTAAAAWIPPHTDTLVHTHTHTAHCLLLYYQHCMFFSCECFAVAVEPTPSGRARLPAGGQMGVISLFLPPPGAGCQLGEISITPVCNWLN